MIVFGVLVAGLSGLCTLTLALPTLAPGAQYASGGAPFLGVILVIGGPFIAGGVGLVIGGIALWRRPRGE